MGPVKFLLDSVVLIDHLNGIPAATEFLSSTSRESAVSVVTRAEVLTGFDPAEEGAALRLLDRYPTLNIDATIADLAARLRRRERWKMPDAFQAALATYHGLLLATRNSKDFPPSRYSFVLIPYTV